MPGRRPLAEQANDSPPLSDDDDSTQTGVKRLEVVAATWSKLALVVAYAGCVHVVRPWFDGLADAW